MSEPAHCIAPPNAVLSPLQSPPTSCFPMLFCGLTKAAQRRRSRAKTMDTVQTYKKELAAAAAAAVAQEEQQQLAETSKPASPVKQQEGTSEVVAAETTTNGTNAAPGIVTLAAAMRGTNLRRRTFDDVRTLHRAHTTVGRFNHGGMPPLSPVLSPGLDESETSSSAAPTADRGSPTKEQPLGLISCESEDLSCAAPLSPVVSSTAAAARAAPATTTTTTVTTSKLTLTASITTTTTTTSTLAPPPLAQAAAAPVPARRPPLRSQSMGSMPRPLLGSSKSAAAAVPVPPTGNDRFYHPALRRSGSKSMASSSFTSNGDSALDSSIPSLGALRNRFSSRRKSFAGMSRRLSMDELVQPREDYVYQPLPSAPALPPRLLPMISNGMARLAINMKDAVLTPATWEVMLSLFSPEDAAKITRYRFDKDRRLSLGSQLLQRAVIAWTFGVPYPTITISRTEKGKPFYKPPPEALKRTPFPNWNYNVSHHGDFVGIASEPVCLVGLDIMNAKEKPRGNKATANDFFKSFHRQLSANEWGSIYQAPNEECKLERFYKQWALKEAYIKAIGSGLSFSPRRIEITGLDHSEQANSSAAYDPSILRIDGMERPDWRFKFAGLDHGHVACVSRGPPSDAIADYRQYLPEPHLPNSPLMYGLESVQPEFDLIDLRELIPTDHLAAFDASLGHVAVVGGGEEVKTAAAMQSQP